MKHRETAETDDFELTSCVYKLQYDSYQQAIRTAKQFGKPLRAYKCQFCHLWHLTSQRP